MSIIKAIVKQQALDNNSKVIEYVENLEKDKSNLEKLLIEILIDKVDNPNEILQKLYSFDKSVKFQNHLGIIYSIGGNFKDKLC